MQKTAKIEELSQIDWAKVDWQEEIGNNINSIEKLKEYVELSDAEEKELEEVVGHHPMNIPRYYLNLIDWSEPQKDPIALLAIPRKDELVVSGANGETTKDPYGDEKHNKGNGILHKYPYSALVVASDYCSMYCRHCFRKAIVGLPNDKTVESFEQAAKYIREHKEITNVVISGGDPLLLPTPLLKRVLNSLVDIEHLNYVRIGSRTPVVYPMRFFDDELIQVFREFNERKTLYLPTHFNHTSEITEVSRQAVLRVRQAGVTVNNQAVLLKGVNDTADEIERLMNGLTTIGVNPYYLYQCMPVTRVRNHFQVTLKRGIDLVDKAKQRLDGYAKRFKFIMGHDSGKIEIIGRMKDQIILKQIHSRPETPELASQMMIYKLNDQAGWMEDLEVVNETVPG